MFGLSFSQLSSLALLAVPSLANPLGYGGGGGHGYGGGGHGSGHGNHPSPRDGHWVDTWTTMPQLTEFQNLPPAPFNETELVFANSTIRQTLHMSIGAQNIRIRIANTFGLNQLPVTKVTIGYPLSGSGYNKTGSPLIDPSSMRTLTFSGNESIIIPNGANAVSDPLSFPIAPESELSVSMYLAEGQMSNYITSHPGSRVSSWISSGDYTESRNLTDPSTVQIFHWYFLSAVEAWAPKHSGAFVIVGDSITDGRSSYNNANERWPDLVLRRMQQYAPTRDIAVVNQAAGGNRVLYDGLGPNAFGRIERDVLAQSGVKYAMIFEGVNDIGVADTTAENQTQTGDRLIQAYKQMITKVHTYGIPFFGATITPFGCYNTSIQPYASPIREETRLRVNEWIRNSGAFDTVLDFDAVLRDPQNYTQLNPMYDSGDCLHPSPAGYRHLANEFPLDVFAKFQNGVSSYD